MSVASAMFTAQFKSTDVLYEEAQQGRQFDAVYFAMMIFACLIALMGLLLNSPAVIIGAMLISPLMGPILACGLALTTAEWSLGKKAARNLALSVAEVVLIAMIATHLSPLREPTPEILARTNPNLMDLLIAFFSGLAGTVALASRKTAFTVLPGVAIATAVMPPLATVGYGISTRQWAIASGSFMLFFTNFTAIVLSASLVFLLIGFRPQTERTGESHHVLIRWRIAIAATVLALLSIPLLRTLIRASEQANIRSQVHDTLKEHAREHSRQLDSVAVELDHGIVKVNASIETAQFIEPSEVGQLRALLERRVGKSVRLEVQQLQLAHKAASTEQVIRDFLAAGLVRPAAVEKPPSPASDIGALQQRLETSLGSLVGVLGVSLRVTSVGKATDGYIAVNATGSAPHLTAEDTWKVAAAGLAADISAPTSITATVAATGTALTISYRGAEPRPSSAELRRVRKFNSSLPKDVSLAFLPSPQTDPALAARRVAHLRQLLSRPIIDMNLAPPAAANDILIVPVQTITAASEHSGGVLRPSSTGGPPTT